jgi:hypothetical protein
MADFRFALVLENGEPADPPALNTAFRSGARVTSSSPVPSSSGSAFSESAR